MYVQSTAGAVVAAYRQELSVGLMFVRTGMLRDAVERSLDPQDTRSTRLIHTKYWLTPLF